LKNTFRLFESEGKGKLLDIRPLAGDLFGYDAIGVLNNCHLDNKTILECLKNLSVFINQDTGQKMRVNYASLNTEEFGSVYEGLLEYAPEVIKEDGGYRFIFTKGSERSATGTHYTPDELVQPLIKHSLDYIIDDKLKGPNAEKALLTIRVCDVAAGSAHILLNAARRIGAELAKVRTGEDQPSPTAYRAGVRDAIRNCIYGVDKNPLAVELCKVSLWLEAHIPGEPLNFLDHHIKCGDSIVGLAHKEELLNGIATEAFKKLPGDDPDVVKRLAKKNRGDLEQRQQLTISFEQTVTDDVKNIAALLNKLTTMPETTPVEVVAKQKEYQKLTGGSLWWRLKNLADIQTAQFFIPKTKDNEKKLITDAEYREYLKGRQMVGIGVAKATAAALDKRFFHWFLEFPEVFMDGGFDCILGNPPFLGNRKLKGTFGETFLDWVRYYFAPAGAIELVGYFFRRIFDIVKPQGFQALIATNTIAQGEAREGSLDVILNKGGSINFAVRSMKWPGLAAVDVSLVNIFKGKWKQQYILGSKPVKQITAYLDDAETTENPYPLLQNADKSFQGSIVLGKGFVLEPHEAMRLIEKNPKNKDVLFPYINGEDLNTNPDQSPSRWVINFFDWPEEKCRNEYPDCFEIIEKLVKPERQRKDVRGNYVLRKPLPEKWWIYADKRPKLYRTIASLERVFSFVRISKYLSLSILPMDWVYNDKCIILAENSFAGYSILQSSFNDLWAWRYATTLGGQTIVYTPALCYESFPFPQNLASEIEQFLEQTGKKYHDCRRQIMLKMQLGLTKTYNQFHNKQLSVIDGDLPENEIEKKYGKETMNLWNYLKRTGNTCPLNEAVEGILELRRLHREMDETVLKAYGWTDINLAHDFYEVDYLPENDRIRYTISPEARREILKRLLKLNHEIHEKKLAENDQTTVTKKSSKAKKSKTNSKQISLL
jgi:hypothetical protein